VRTWFDSIPDDELFTCTVVIGELARGVANLPLGEQRRRVHHQLHHEVIPAFADRILGFDLPAALRWGFYMGEGRRTGETPPNDDLKIAAIAAVHRLTVVTANFRHFARLGVPCLNPTVDG
jgi:predicted nucleic acid-binding protein